MGPLDINRVVDRSATWYVLGENDITLIAPDNAAWSGQLFASLLLAAKTEALEHVKDQSRMLGSATCLKDVTKGQKDLSGFKDFLYYTNVLHIFKIYVNRLQYTIYISSKVQ